MNSDPRSSGYSSLGIIFLMFILGLCAPLLWNGQNQEGEESPAVDTPAPKLALRAPRARQRGTVQPRTLPVTSAAVARVDMVDLSDQVLTGLLDDVPVTSLATNETTSPAPDLSVGVQRLWRETVMRRLPSVGATLPILVSAVTLPTPKVEQPVAVKAESVPSVVKPEKAVEIPAATRHWPYAVDLMNEVEPLADHPLTSQWVERLGAHLDALHHADSLSSVEAERTFRTLASMAIEARELAKQATSPTQYSALLRASYSLIRRVIVWQHVRQVAVQPVQANASLLETTALLTSIKDASRRLQTVKSTGAWRDFLRLDELEAAAQSGDAARRAELESIALVSLLHAHSPTMSVKQRRFLEQPEFQKLFNNLAVWAGQPVDYRALMNQLEDFEKQETTASALAIAYDLHRLKWSGDRQRVALAHQINTHYRNANLRFAISESMVNRLLPTSEVIRENVNDVIQGARVRGRSATLNRLRVVLVPDRRRWRMGLEARGRIASETRSEHGPAVFFSDGLSRYRAQKQVVIDKQGVQVGRTQVKAVANSDLTGLETAFDPVPLVGLLARAIAQQQHDSQIDQAESEAEVKVAGRIRDRMDREVEDKVREAEQQFQTNLLTPLQQVGVEPVITDLRTTKERLIARYRIAGYSQLAAYTARPQAPANSLLSVQVHQSALNNVLANLGLDGERTDLAELVTKLKQLFSAESALTSEEIPEGVTLQFAKRDAVRVEFHENRATITLKLAELSRGKSRWRYFIVRAHYIPDVKGLNASLVRDSYIELSGRRLSFRDQIALRGIFCKVLDKKKPLQLVNQKIRNNRKLQDLMVTQCRIDNGWIGLAVGPKSKQANSHVANSRATSKPGSRKSR